MKKLQFIILLVVAFACSTPVKKEGNNKQLAESIAKNEYFPLVKSKALEVMKTGFNAGDGYREVWIRDYNTFIELAAQVFPKEELKENLLVFCRMQGDDGNIIDGFTPIDKVGKEAYDFAYSKLEPRYAAHKNSVETDQESSLIQAVYKYIKLTGDTTILNEKVGDKTVAERLEWAMDFLMKTVSTRSMASLLVPPQLIGAMCSPSMAGASIWTTTPIRPSTFTTMPCS